MWMLSTIDVADCLYFSSNVLVWFNIVRVFCAERGASPFDKRKWSCREMTTTAYTAVSFVHKDAERPEPKHVWCRCGTQRVKWQLLLRDSTRDCATRILLYPTTGRLRITWEEERAIQIERAPSTSKDFFKTEPTARVLHKRTRCIFLLQVFKNHDHAVSVRTHQNKPQMNTLCPARIPRSTVV